MTQSHGRIRHCTLSSIHLTEPRLGQIISTGHSVLSPLLLEGLLPSLPPLSLSDICPPGELLGSRSVGTILYLEITFVGSFIDKSALSHEILVMVQVRQIRQYPALVHGRHFLVPDPAAPVQLVIGHRCFSYSDVTFRHLNITAIE